jgi:outer membrane protein TolC
VAPDIRVEDLSRTANEVCKTVEGVDTRADVLAASRTLEAAKRDRQAVTYTYFPTLDLTSSLSYTNATLISPNGEHVNWSVAGILVWPIYDGGIRYGLRKINEGAVTIANEQLVQKKRDATLQIVQADRSIVVAEANVQVATTARDVARESARLARLAFVNGSGTSFDLVDNTRRLREAEIDLLIREFRVFQARLTAYLARANCSI